MAWETRPWTTAPSEQVVKVLRGLPGYRVRLMLDPRSYDTEDANELRVEGTVLACSQNGPTLILEETDGIGRGRFALIDILMAERI